MHPVKFLGIFLMSLLTTIVVAQKGSQQVSMFRGNPQLTGVLQNMNPVNKINNVKFTFQTKGPIRSTPVVANGILCFGSGDGNLYALDAKTGEQRWAFKTSGAVNSHPAIVNQVVYFTSRDKFCK